MSLPRVVSRDSDGSLFFAPVPEVAALRLGHVGVTPAVLTESTSGPGVITGVSGVQLDLELELELDPGAVVRLGVLETRDADGTAIEQTAIELSRGDASESSGAGPSRGTLRLDRTRSSLEADVDTDPREGPVPMPGGRVSLRVIVDRSAVEIFANGKPLTARVYPRLDGGGISLEATEGTARVVRFDAWTMGEIFGGERLLFP
ncbi:GH32 C-terminal domain-containing protein [Arthrobacter sp. SA17]